MPKLDVLHLNLKHEFFDCIARGKKRYEYRDYTPYWRKRLEGRKYDVIQFRNGYATDAPEMIVEWKGVKRSQRQFVIRLGKVLKIRRWRRI